MLDDDFLATDGSVDLHEVNIGGVKYLVEVEAGKVYEVNEDQTFVGKLKGNGEIDYDAVDSSDEEEEEEEGVAVGAQALDEDTATLESLSSSQVVEEKKGEEGGSSNDEVDLHEIMLQGRKMLVDKAGGKVYEANEDQTFLGKLKDNGEIDYDAVDSSDEEEGW